MPRLLFILLMLITSGTFSQNTSLTGIVKDTSDNRPLHNAVVSIIEPEDSILIQFTRTDVDGKFHFSGLPKSPFIVQITFPKYADFMDLIRDSSKAAISMDIIPLTKRSELLEAVIVRRQLSAIRVRGDTLAYMADSFAVTQGATVDQLLKQLPGIQVDRNGVITAQGQKVNKVLVDGEEFFSDDPAVVVKNLQAEAVKEVQVFDKKSEQAEFTGIDDGERSRTINLTLKPEKKKGYFGRVNLNGGTDGSFDNDLMINSFKGTRKVAMFGIMSNTGRQGLNWQEMDKFGGGLDLEFNEDEGYFNISNYDEEFGEDMNRNDGLPAAWSAGFHFSDKWKGDANKVNLNYRLLKKNLNAEANTISQYILPDTQYFNSESKRSYNSRFGQQAKGIYEIKFDSSSTMKVTVIGNWSTNENAATSISRALNADSGLVNNNSRFSRAETDNTNFMANILWRKKFKKIGRTLSVNIQQKRAEESLDGYLNSATDYFDSNGVIDNHEQVDQKKNNSSNKYTATSNIVYTEPLSKKVFLSFNYGLNMLLSNANRNSFNDDGNGVYDKLDSIFSSNFQFRYLIHSAGADIKINKKKTTFTVGSGIHFSDYKQTDITKDTARSYTFINYFPKVFFKYSASQYRTFTIRYDGRNNPPSLEQLQPILENTDPLNIRIGNPNLRQEFRHNFSLSFNDYQVVSEKGVYFHTYGNVMQNAISTATVVDEGGKTTYQPINVDGNYVAGVYTGFMMKLKKLGTHIDIGGNMTKNHVTNQLNNLNNTNDYSNYSLYVGLRKSKNEKYSFSFRPNIGYTFSKSSLRPDVKTNYITSETELSAWMKLPWKLEFWSAAYINLRQKTDVFDVNRNVVQWDANIVRKFLKNNNLEFKVAVFDLLNQNIGFRRTVNTNIISENSYNTLRRRFMVGIQYNISKNPGQ